MALKYRLSAIGWYNFETLVQTLLKAVIGPGVSAFGGTMDEGRDASYVGQANFPSSENPWDGEWIFQVKHSDFEERGTKAARKSLEASLGSEIKKILSHGDGCDNYIYITNVPLMAKDRKRLEVKARSSGFTGNFFSLDGKDICNLLDVHDQIRRAYPQLLALADLDLIVHKDIYTRSKSYLQYWQKALGTFVRTEVYEEALKRLRRRHFIVLDGPPETGKTTIAAALALSLAVGGFQVLEVRSPTDIMKSYERDSSQLFLADDALGSIELQPELADNWARDLPEVLELLDERHWLIWTARMYVLREALSESKLGEVVPDEFPETNEVLVEVGRLNKLERAGILYNHAKAAGLGPKSKEVIKANAERFVDDENFTPLRVSQLFTVFDGKD